MNIISYSKLYKYYTEVEKLSISATLRNIRRVRHLPKDLKEIVEQIIDRGIDKKDVTISDMTLHGVTLQELTEKDGMSPINAVLFMDWLRRKPYDAMEFMRCGRFRTPIEPFNDKELEMIKRVIENLESDGIKSPEIKELDEDSSESDIKIEDTETVGAENSTEEKIENEDKENKGLGIKYKEH